MYIGDPPMGQDARWDWPLHEDMRKSAKIVIKELRICWTKRCPPIKTWPETPMVQTAAAVVCHPAGGGRQWK